MKKAFLVISCFVLLLIDSMVFAKEYPVYQLSNKPKLDGKLDDPLWDSLPEGRGFQTMRGEYPLTRQNFFKIGQYQDILYIGVKCEEPNPKKINVLSTYRDGLVSDESVEFFIMKPGSKYLQMITNAKGARWCRWEGDRRALEAPADWEVATDIGNSSWTLEMAIPIKLFSPEHQMDREYFFNICRTAKQAKDGFKYNCWSAAKNGFGDKENFDKLTFSKFAGPADVNLKNEEINSTYDQFLFSSLQKVATKGKEYRNLKARFATSPLIGDLDKLQQKIKESYKKIPKSEIPVLYREWVELVKQVAINRRCIELIAEKNDVKNLQIFINGKQLQPENDLYRAYIIEGLTTIAVMADAGGANPGVKIRVKDAPDTAIRWRVTDTDQPEWKTVKFNDNKWQLAGKNPSGYIWDKAGGQKLFMRQTLIWNYRYDGNLRCLNPSVKIWEISPDSMEIMYMSLYSPVGRKISDYNFYFEMPEGFELLDMKTDRPLHKLNISPEKISIKKISRNGIGYRQYCLTYPDKMIHEWQSYDSILPIFNKTWNTVGKQGNFYYYRQLNGNITELTGKVPFKIIPPINGKMPKKVKLSFYRARITQPISREVHKKVVDEASKAGFNFWDCYPWASGVGKYHKDLIRQNGGKICLTYLNYPIWGALKKSELEKLIEDNPELQPTYFKNFPKEKLKSIGKNHGRLPRYCQSVALGKRRKEFIDAVTADFKKIIFGPTPDAEYFFLNYEYNAWVNENSYRKAKRGEGATCFCDLCREEFRKYAKLPADKPLTDDEIFNKYYYEWEKFCYSQHAKVHKIVYDILKGMGKKGWFYSGTHHYPYWEAAGKIHHELFLGSPGNGEINCRRQKNIDKHRKYFLKVCGNVPTSGQRFSMFRNTYGYNFDKREGWRKFQIMSEDGILHPKSWKRQTLRMCATYGGGYDLQCPMEIVSGMKYYIGEASRLIADYEDIFWANNRQDDLVESKDIAYPNALVLTKDDQRIVLLFNETKDDKTVSIRNKGLKPGQNALLYYENRKVLNPEEMTVTIPANDVVAIVIK